MITIRKNNKLRIAGDGHLFGRGWVEMKGRDKFSTVICDAAGCKNSISRANRVINAARKSGRGVYCSRKCIAKNPPREKFRYGLIPTVDTYLGEDLKWADGGPRSLRAAAAGALVILSSCAPLPDSVANDDQAGQSGQGKDRWSLVVPCPTGKDPDRICPVNVDLGRDKEHVSIKARLRNASFEYLATGATGENQAAVRAVLERASSETTNETTRQILQGVIANLPEFMPKRPGVESKGTPAR